jgi:hypothetical protein
VCHRHKEDLEKPGVGAYTVNNNALGKQAVSTKKTLPSPKIGTSNRDAAKKVRVVAQSQSGTAYKQRSQGGS